MDVNQKRNVVIVGHAHCGKTSLVESTLFSCGAISRKGDVTNGNTVSDFSDDEIQRKISINASYLKATCKGHEIQLIDTPGYMDFIGEMIAAIHVADAAVVVIDAVNGIEVGTEDIWERLEQQKTPRLVFVNKTDKDDAKTADVLAAIREDLSKKAIPVDLGSPQLIEAVAETNDQLLEKYLESGSLSEPEVQDALRRAVLEAKIFPVITGSALKDTNIQTLLDAIITYLPSPVERRPFLVAANGTAPGQVQPTLDGPFLGFIFKSLFDPHLGQLSLMKVIRGHLKVGDTFLNVDSGNKENAGAMSFLQGKEQMTVSEVGCGDIVAFAKLKSGHVNNTLAADKEKVHVSPILFPEPAISASIKPKSRSDEEKISISLQRICEEDHTVRVHRDNETKEQIIAGVGDLHLKVLIDRMKTRYHVDVELGRPKVSYRETITKKARYRYKYKKQSGGRGQYGDVEIEIAPLPRDGAEYEFVDKIFGGAIPRNFIPSAEKGIKLAITEGAIVGFPIVNIQVTLVDGSYHDVDSSDMAFQIAGLMALKEAVKLAGAVLLEPIMDVSVVIPDEFIGAISGDVSSRRGKIMGSEQKGKNQITKALIPLAEMFSYATDLRSITGGRGSYSMTFSHYEQVPAKITQQIIAEKQQVKEEVKV